MKIKRGQIFEHYKNHRLYKVNDFAINEKDGKEMVVYEDIESHGNFVRPLEEFTAQVDGVERFKLFEDSMKDKLEKIAEYYGALVQVVQAIQELSELIHVLTVTINADNCVEFYCSKKDFVKANREHLIEEIADSQVMINQCLYIFRISDHEIEKCMKAKISRQLQRIEKLNEFKKNLVMSVIEKVVDRHMNHETEKRI